jgi:hypothetical protein
MSHGGEVAFGPLDLEHLPVALFRIWKIIHEGAGVAEVPKGIRQCLRTAGHSVIRHSCFPGGASLGQIAAMEKNPCAMFMILAHEIVKRYL